MLLDLKHLPFLSQFAKRDTIREIEKEVQRRWEAEKVFYVDAPSEDQVGDKYDHSNKYFVTFPYPYMNGRLHLGHTYTILKVIKVFLLVISTQRLHVHVRLLVISTQNSMAIGICMSLFVHVIFSNYLLLIPWFDITMNFA